MRRIFIITLTLLFIMPVMAGEDKDKQKKDESEKKELARIAEKIRSGEIDVGKDLSTNVKTGRFHIIHADKLLMDCTNCHYGVRYRDDYQAVDKFKPYPARAKGRYQRSVCLGCHTSGGIATRWYNSSTQP